MKRKAILGRVAVISILIIVGMMYAGCALRPRREKISVPEVCTLWGGDTHKDYLEFLCELRGYQLQSGFCDRAAFQKLSTGSAHQGLVVRGFVFTIIEPREYTGKELRAHWDGDLVAGDPIRAFAFGKKYRALAPKDSVGVHQFELCPFPGDLIRANHVSE